MAVTLEDEQAMETEPAARVVVSLMSEIFWALLAATKASAREQHRPLDELYASHLDLPRRVEDFWDDGRPCYDELAVLAHFGGVLSGAPSLDDFLAAIDDATRRVPDDLRLGSESPAHRARLLARLARLRQDAALRARYAELLACVWSPLDPDWRNELPSLAATSDRLNALLATGTTWRDLLPSNCHLFDFEQLREHAGRELVAATPAVLALSHFAAKLAVIDLTDVLFCSIAPPGVAAAERERAGVLGRQLRAVADPTRLSLLRLLASGDRRVGDLAVRLGVSQPTVSNHLKVLKASGLVRSERRDGRQRLAVDTTALERTLADLVEFVGSAG